MKDINCLKWRAGFLVVFGTLLMIDSFQLAAAEPNARPNILLIVSDQQRLDTLGCLGRTPCRTPNLDRLTEQGVCFDRCITPSPICGPARTSLFTGLYPHQARGLLGRDDLGVRDKDQAEGDAVDMMLNDCSLREPPLLCSGF